MRQIHPYNLLVSGDVTIDGTINVSGESGQPLGNGQGGLAGPGGFDGGDGALFNTSGLDRGEDGHGPGGGQGGHTNGGGAGGSFATQGVDGPSGPVSGPIYGSEELVHLIGGSGGGGQGAHASNVTKYRGGGGGGGAILIAASGSITINGSILAQGAGEGEDPESPGAGSGGAIKLVATTINESGSVNAVGGSGQYDGGAGRIRLEAEDMLYSGSSDPIYTFSTPTPVFYANIPSIRISSVGGEAVPLNPTGHRDVVLPGITANPVTVEFETVGVPVGTTITLGNHSGSATELHRDQLGGNRIRDFGQRRCGCGLC